MMINSSRAILYAAPQAGEDFAAPRAAWRWKRATPSTSTAANNRA
jgi:hypothetical protein